MPASTSLGEGIGLQSGHRNDYWMRRLADDQRIDDARNAKAERDLVNSADFSIDTSKYLPYYANQMVQERVKIINDIAKMRQHGNVSRGQMQQRIMQSQGRISEIEMSNQAAKRYIEDKNIIHDDKLVSAFMNNKTTSEELQKYNRGQFLQLGPQGQFAYQGVKNTPIPLKYDLNTDYDDRTRDNPRVIGNQREYMIDRVVKPGAIDRESASLYNNPDFIAQTLYDAQGNSPTPLTDEEMVAVVRNRADARAKSEVPLGASRVQLKTIPQPSQSSGSADKKRNAEVIRNSTATILIPREGEGGRLARETDINSPNYDQIIYDEATTNIPLQRAVYVKTPQTMLLNDNMIDADTNKKIKASGQINFRPDNVVVIPVKGKDGKTTFKQYASGSVTRNVGTGEEEMTRGDMYSTFGDKKDGAIKTEKVFKILVPLDDARSHIQADDNDLSEFDREFTELGKPVSTKKPAAKSQPTQATITKRTTDNRGLISVTFKEKGKEGAFDFLTAQEFADKFPGQSSVNGPDEYNALPKGAEYVYNGEIRRKK